MNRLSLNSFLLDRMLDNAFENILNQDIKCVYDKYKPVYDIIEFDDKFTVDVQLPGISKDDVIVNVDEGVLIVFGNKKQKDVNYLRKLSTDGEFELKLKLPDSCDLDNIEGDLNDGILSVTISKKVKSTVKTVKIK